MTPAERNKLIKVLLKGMEDKPIAYHKDKLTDINVPKEYRLIKK